MRFLDWTTNFLKILAACVLLSVTVPSPAQAPEHDYYWGYGETVREAIDDLKLSIDDIITVATKSRLENDNGKYDYSSAIGTEAYFVLPQSGITIIQVGDYYKAGIEKDKVQHVEGKWVEQNITVNNTYNAVPTYSRGFRRTNSTTITTRRRNIRGPSGNIVNSIPGKTTETVTKDAWNGSYGWRYEKNRIKIKGYD